MVYLFETEISNTKKVKNSLKDVYGLGDTTTNVICSKLGISKNSRICDLPDFKIKQIANYLDFSQLFISSNLKKIKSKASKNLISIKSVRGIRKLKGLPVRGQRTHTNAKNSKKRRIY